MMNENERNINLLGQAHDEVYKLDISSLEKGKIEVLINRVQESLITQSAVVMPKVFNDWFKLFDKPTQGKALSILYWIVFDIDSRTHKQQNLYDWIKGDGSESMIMRRISKCVIAIRCGYEVEK